MTIHIITIFPEVIKPYLNSSMLLRAQKKGLVTFKVWNPRDFSLNKHKKVDDRQYGGGPGMVLSAEPILRAVRKAIGKRKAKILILSPRGKLLDAQYAKRLSKVNELVLIAGHYEGIDARVKSILRAHEISVGDYTLTGGELPALTLTDAVVRQIKGTLGNSMSLEEDRITSGVVYTRPYKLVWRGRLFKVPRVLTTGHHSNIDVWRGQRGGK